VGQLVNWVMNNSKNKKIKKYGELKKRGERLGGKGRSWGWSSNAIRWLERVRVIGKCRRVRKGRRGKG